MQTLLQFFRDTPDQVNAIVAALALVVSLLSIVITVVSLFIQRQHNYKSLTPIGSIPFLDYEDKVAVKVKNTGVGPLIIETFRVTDGKRSENDLISWMPPLPGNMPWDTFFDDLDGACIPPGEQLTVLQLSGNPSDQSFAKARDSCRRALSQLTILFKYRDIYARRMSAVQKSLKWFGRHFN